MNPLAERVAKGERRAVARALTVVERGGAPARELLRDLFPHSGRAQVVGVTGAPGVGKSTLVDATALAARAEGRKVGIVAVDPSSPFSGGAILGDRIRMQEATMDPGVFMRSLANRGQSGGLSRAAAGSIEVLDAAGFDLILVETVGAGQSEIEIMALAHTTAVVLAPGLGDDIQAIKAGILEIADVFVVNKADRDGADHTVREIRAMLHLAAAVPPWQPPIIKTVAEARQGVAEFLDAIDRHHAFLKTSGVLEERRLLRAETLVRQALWERVEAELVRHRDTPGFRRQIEGLLTGARDPAGVADWIWSGGAEEA
jgi:LAO/AO transport system kinase